MSDIVSKVNVNNTVYDLADNYCRSLGNGKLFFGTCATAGATKVVTCNAFTASDLTDGTALLVKFTATNTGAVASITLNVNGTGAKSVKKQTNSTVGNVDNAGRILANYTYLFVYSNNYWNMIYDINSTYSAISEANIKSSSSTSAGLITGQRFNQAVKSYCNASYNSSTATLTVNLPTT